MLLLIIFLKQLNMVYVNELCQQAKTNHTSLSKLTIQEGFHFFHPKNHSVKEHFLNSLFFNFIVFSF